MSKTTALQEVRDQVRDKVVKACESRGAQLQSRQIEAVTEVMGDLLIGIASQLAEVKKDVAMLYQAVASIIDMYEEDHPGATGTTPMIAAKKGVEGDN